MIFQLSCPCDLIVRGQGGRGLVIQSNIGGHLWIVVTDLGRMYLLYWGFLLASFGQILIPILPNKDVHERISLIFFLVFRLKALKNVNIRNTLIIKKEKVTFLNSLNMIAKILLILPIEKWQGKTRHFTVHIYIIVSQLIRYRPGQSQGLLSKNHCTFVN